MKDMTAAKPQQQAKPTPGPWRVMRARRFLHIVGDVNGTPHCIAKVGAFANPKCVADADIFAEAGTVYHETGLTPRQLADQRAELLGALEFFARGYADRWRNINQSCMKQPAPPSPRRSR